MRGSRIASCLAVLAVAATLAVHSAAALAQPATLRFSTWLTPNSEPSPQLAAWARSLQAGSNGALVVQMFEAEQLGRARDHYDMARDGIADITWAVPGFNPGRFPIFAAFELPYMTSSASEGIVVFDAWYRRHVAREMPDVIYCLAITTPVSTLHFARQVNTPAEIRGLRMRPQNATAGRYFSQLGAPPINMTAAEARQGFERGLLDGIAFPWRTLLPFGLERFVRFHMDMPFATGPSAIVINRRRYESLTAPQRAAVDSHCTAEWSRRIVKAWEDFEAEGRAMLLQRGNTIYPVAPEAQQAWRDSAREIYAEWVRDASAKGIDGAAELALLQTQLRARNAGF